jgi:glyoxylase-like metal-dependent hydrolase (beta-lactamase superfamily II)
MSNVKGGWLSGRRWVVGAAWIYLGGLPLAVAHQVHEEKQEIFSLQKLSERAYCLFGRGGNVGILMGPDSILIVDDQYAEIAPGIIEKVRTISPLPIKYLVNTHYHADHTGGNGVFQPLTLIVAHDNVRPRMIEQAREEKPDLKVEQVPAPVVTFTHELRIYLDPEPIRVFYIYGGHTDGDSVIYRASDKVLHMGDLFFNGVYPYIDIEGGGSIDHWLESIDAVLGQVAPDVQVIPGHGPVSDLAGLRHFRSYLADTQAMVQTAIKSGLSKEQILSSLKNEKYPGMKPAGSFTSWEKNLGWIYDDLTR